MVRTVSPSQATTMAGLNERRTRCLLYTKLVALALHNPDGDKMGAKLRDGNHGCWEETAIVVVCDPLYVQQRRGVNLEGILHASKFFVLLILFKLWPLERPNLWPLPRKILFRG